MLAENLAPFRKRMGWTQKQIAEMLNLGLDRKYDETTIGRWERKKMPIPAHVSRFLDEIELKADFPLREDTLEGEHEHPEDAAAPGRETVDSAPPPPPSAPPQTGAGAEGLLALTPGPNPHLARVCEELWEMVATGVGLVGAVTGSEALRRDGAIIHDDKQALGKAYGKLAETNATFRKMLAGATSSGAWLEVAMVSGITAGKLMRNHQTLREAQRQEAQIQAEQETVLGGDGSLGYQAAA